MTISQNYTTQEQVNSAFFSAWMDYNKEEMKRLISDPNLSFHFNMNYSHQQGHKHTGATHFMEVCAKGDLDFVQFILTNQNVKHKISINDNGWYASTLSYAVMSGNLELVKYMLTSDLPEKAQIMHEYSEHVELMNFIQQKGYVIQEHDSSYYERDKTGNLVKIKF